MNPYDVYCSFVDRSTLLNKVLYTIRDRWGCLGIPTGDYTYDDAERFNHLIMFLAQVMAFEAFVARCLRDECGLTQKRVRKMDIETRVRVLLPRAAGDPDLPGQLEALCWAYNLRHTWMHCCGDPELPVDQGRVKKNSKVEDVPQDIFDAARWIDAEAWSKTASALTGIAAKIAERFGWKAAEGGDV